MVFTWWGQKREEWLTPFSGSGTRGLLESTEAHSRRTSAYPAGVSVMEDRRENNAIVSLVILDEVYTCSRYPH